MAAERYLHEVVADLEATGLRVGVIMRAAYEIAGAAWNASWRDRDGRTLVIAFEVAEMAESFRAWLAEQAC